MSLNFLDQIQSKSNKELVDIYTNYTEYQPEFVEIVRGEILKRNIPIDSIDHLKERKEAIDTKTLELGRQGNPVYLALIGLGAFFGGIPAIIGGYIYAFSRHSDAKGEKYFVYNDSTRKWGEIIFYIGLGVLLLTIILNMVNL